MLWFHLSLNSLCKMYRYNRHALEQTGIHTHIHTLWLCREASHDALGCITGLLVLGWWRCYGNRGGGERECDLKELKMFGNRGDGFPQWPPPHQPITESVWESSFSLSNTVRHSGIHKGYTCFKPMGTGGFPRFQK